MQASEAIWGKQFLMVAFPCFYILLAFRHCGRKWIEVAQRVVKVLNLRFEVIGTVAALDIIRITRYRLQEQSIK